jgi:hypothetical protein
MKTGDILLKKWCFGIGRAKPRKMMEQNSSGEANTYITYPKYRTIAVQVESAEQKGKMWHVKGKQFATLTGKPKAVELVVEQKGEKYPLFVVAGQKRPFHFIPASQAGDLTTDEGMPPVGSLISLNKKHALVVGIERNQLTVFVNGQYDTVAVKPGSIKWTADKLLTSLAKKS